MYVYVIYVFLHICCDKIHFTQGSRPFLRRSRHLNTPRRQQSQRAGFALHHPPDEEWEAPDAQNGFSLYSKMGHGTWDMLSYVILFYYGILGDFLGYIVTTPRKKTC